MPDAACYVDEFARLRIDCNADLSETICTTSYPRVLKRIRIDLLCPMPLS